MRDVPHPFPWLRADVPATEDAPAVRPIDPAHRAEKDRELMRLVARRDPNAQKHLVTRLVRRVRKLSALLVTEATEAEDATQLVLIELLQSAASFKEDQTLERWADGITVRTTLRLAQQARQRRSFFRRFTGNEQPLGAAPEEGATDQPPDLEQFLLRLSDVRREALVLKYALGFSIEEIAVMTSAPPGTVKDRIIVAKRQLRGLLEREAKRADKRSPNGGAE